MPTLDRHDAVFVLDLGNTENRFHPDWIAEVNAHLDQVEKEASALVTTATGKIRRVELRRMAAGLLIEPLPPAEAAAAETTT